MTNFKITKGSFILLNYMKNLLIIGFIWPEPSSTAAGTRMLQLIELFQKNNYNITFVSTSLKTDKSYLLEKLNINTYDIQLNNSSFDKLLTEINPDAVLFDRYLTEEQFGWRVLENCPNALKILDTEDLHFLRFARQQTYKNNSKLTLDLLVNDVTKREIASIYRCDLSLIISKFEMNLLTKTFKISKSILKYIPFLLDNINLEKIKSYPNFKNRQHFISIGNFKHEPNWNAVLYLKNHIWPKIHKDLPNSQLHIYGAYCTDKVLQLHNVNDGFLIKGWTDNLEKVFTNSKICLAPIQFGAGLKGKLINAMEFGTPSVTTSIGAESMSGNLKWNGFICDDPNEFALKAVELYKNEKIWENSQVKGIEIINKCYSKLKFSKKLIRKIEEITNNLEAHRQHNFIGSILQYHTLKSTKYMSKWIEEKNKN
ncbi:Glycosyltransferase involved in cell wall bisynthesis [Lutibacter flavus]|uniref:Glycosyltransferase involved in cell wall bisynthesis n=2 Tax=Lutibacter flavus TaxID=691689 RepID=A0A238VP67_9FLAO|nr:Glycosyltransferase involved in cell wall bisynthesis [Lutibacter flavus]